jgi:hypothetical protein
MAKSKNTCNKTRPRGNPYEVWKSAPYGDPSDGQTWVWNVLKKWQSPDNEAKNPYARWFCDVHSPIVPNGEIGDTYVADIKKHAKLISTNYDPTPESDGMGGQLDGMGS